VHWNGYSHGNGLPTVISMGIWDSHGNPTEIGVDFGLLIKMEMEM